MRRIKVRRRMRALLISLLAVTFILFCETRVESFAPQLASFTKAQIEDRFDKNIKLSIGEIEGGIVRPFALKDVKFEDAAGRPLLPFLKITRVSSNYRVWDVFLGKAKRESFLGIFSVEPRINIHFVTVNGRVSGFVRLRGDIADGRVNGRITFLDNFFRKETVEFSGTVRNGAMNLEIMTPAGTVKAEGAFTPDGIAAVNLKVRHVKVAGLDVVCDMTLRNSLVRASGTAACGDLMEGEFQLKNTILNYKPFFDVSSRYNVKSGVLNIANLDIGNFLKVSGRIYLRDPYVMGIKITADNANLGTILSNFGFRGEPVLDGLMNGSFRLSGPAAKVRSDSRFEMRDGTIGGLDFRHLTAALKGEGTVLCIEEARIDRESGYFLLAGEMDLARIGKNSMFEDIRLVSSDTAIIWDGWNVSRMKDVQEVTMQKKVTDDIKFGFKKFFADNVISDTAREGDEVELEYKLHGKESFKVSVGQDNAFFGLEHKDKF